MHSQQREFRLLIDDTLMAEDVLDAMHKIADHFQAWADNLSQGKLGSVPQIFRQGGRISLLPVPPA